MSGNRNSILPPLGTLVGLGVLVLFATAGQGAPSHSADQVNASCVGAPGPRVQAPRSPAGDVSHPGARQGGVTEIPIATPASASASISDLDGNPLPVPNIISVGRARVQTDCGEQVLWAINVDDGSRLLVANEPKGINTREGRVVIDF